MEICWPLLCFIVTNDGLPQHAYGLKITLKFRYLRNVHLTSQVRSAASYVFLEARI